ncbi:hypothetical protein SAMN02799622_05344 [Methylobacterium sp. UNC378MF]|uniref:hypothetical protein n=1 Tax=Methylobacterium sp. UNC378MF TaxID=1502748 RepID=UPI000890441D|nr:hypothetical protein [Methylobacterium sp. UNC378MF]SDA32876.1 hypothetical protein SAMN02799622_05344 [Methylobacterium sp. UNC378MF]
MPKLTVTRARAITNEVVYLAALPEDEEANAPFTRLLQFDRGKWEHVDYNRGTQRLARYVRPEGGRIAVLLSPQGDTYSPNDSFKAAVIAEDTPELQSTKKLGRMVDIRQIGADLYACGDGGQTYRRVGKDGVWHPLDLGLFDDEISNDWVFEIRAPGATMGEQDKYWGKHPDLKRERDRRIDLSLQNKKLYAINGPSPDDIYIASGNGEIFHNDGHTTRKLTSPVSSALLDILVQDPDTVWVSGRDGTLLCGNARAGFQTLASGRQGFSTMALFEGKIYLSSFASPRGLFVYDGQLWQVASDGARAFDDVHTVDARDGVLWVIGSTTLARFDGKSWERIKLPEWAD